LNPSESIGKIFGAIEFHTKERSNLEEVFIELQSQTRDMYWGINMEMKSDTSILHHYFIS
jgi:hypothetical protein